MQASPRLAEMGRSLGCRPVMVFLRVTLPLILPGVAAALCLVFLSSVTELTATLILVPTGVQTLATQFWAYQTNTAYGAAAPYAVAILLLAAVPNLVVVAWFARRRNPAGARDRHMSGTALRVEGLRVAFGPVQVLTDVNLTVPERSFTAVLGASGSGKTTLLRDRRRIRAARGRVGASWPARRSTRPGRHVPPERRRIGYVPRKARCSPTSPSPATWASGCAARRRSAARVDELLDLVGLAGLQRRYPHELSGGQQQRVALARALALSPSLVLLDEPFASLDAALRTSVRADIARVLRAARTSVVLVTHDQQEALSLADQVAVLRQGRVAQFGEPRQLYARPGDPDLARFLGEANLVPAEIRGSEAITALGALRTEPSPWASGIALIRPEQITVSDTSDAGQGMLAVVAEQTYQGHDSMITLRPVSDCGIDEVRARVPGDRVFSPGDKVMLRAAGPVPTWPAPES